LVLAGVLPVLTGCESLFHSVTYFDPNTYQALAYTKPIVARLYDSFTEGRVDRQQIEDVRLRLAQMREYEVGKGKANNDMTDQIADIQTMFEKHMPDKIDGARWSAVHRDNVKENILDAFDKAIETEAVKNKNANW